MFSKNVGNSSISGQMNTHFFNAAKSGNINLINQLLQAGFNPDMTDENDNTPLMLAVMYQHEEVAKRLSEVTKDINYESKKTHCTAAHLAVFKGNLNIIDKLIEMKANFNVSNRILGTPLHVAANYGHALVIAKLLDCGVAIDAQTHDKATPLHFAVNKGHLDASAKLIEKKADINIQNRLGRTALHMAATQGNEFLVSQLIQAGANINCQDNEGETPLHCAAKNNKLSACEMLIQGNANVNSATNDGLTPLHTAVSAGDETIVDCFIKNGAKIDAQNQRNWQPLHFAAQNGRENIVSTLLEQGAMVNALTVDKSTPLHLAARLGEEKVIPKLIEKGANVNALNEIRMAPLHLAVIRNFDHCFDVLTNAGCKINPHQFRARRALSMVFNEKTLGDLLSEQSTVNLNEGGFVEEAAFTLHTHLRDFIEKKNVDANAKEKFQPILNALLAISESEFQMYKLPLNTHTSILPTGFNKHSVYVLMKDADQAVSKCIFTERGFFYSKKNNESTFSVRVPKEDHPTLLKQLKLARKSDSTIARDIFEKIKVDYKSVGTPLKQKPFKNGHCFMENLKTVLFAEFLEIFGLPQAKLAKLIYKEFDLFMHEMALQKYQEYYAKNTSIEPKAADIIKRCQDIVDVKKEKFKILQQQVEAELAKQKKSAANDPAGIEPVNKKMRHS